MPVPDVDVIACSNVYVRSMSFAQKGDVEIGHSHTYDHATLVSTGGVLYEVLDGENGKVIESKEFYAPDMVFVEKDKYHRLTALSDNTVCACIHALRSIDTDLIPPDSMVKSVHKKRGYGIKEHVENVVKKPLQDIVRPLSK